MYVVALVRVAKDILGESLLQKERKE